MQEPEFEIADEERAKIKQKVEAYRQLGELTKYLEEDFAAVRRILAAKDEGLKLAMLDLFSPFLEIRAAKARGIRVTFRGRFVLIDGGRKPPAPLPSAVTESEPTPESHNV